MANLQSIIAEELGTSAAAEREIKETPGRSELSNIIREELSAEVSAPPSSKPAPKKRSIWDSITSLFGGEEKKPAPSTEKPIDRSEVPPQYREMFDLEQEEKAKGAGPVNGDGARAPAKTIDVDPNAALEAAKKLPVEGPLARALSVIQPVETTMIDEPAAREAKAALLTGATSWIPAGLAFFGGAGMPEAPIEEPTLKKSAEISGGIQKGLTYEPKSKEAAGIVADIARPITYAAEKGKEAREQWDKWAEEKEVLAETETNEEKAKSQRALAHAYRFLGFISETGGEAAPFLAPQIPKAARAGVRNAVNTVRTSDWFRKATIPERDLVTISLTDMINKGMTGEEIRKAWQNPANREELLRKYTGKGATEAEGPAAPESPTSPEPVKPMGGKPSGEEKAPSEPVREEGKGKTEPSASVKMMVTKVERAALKERGYTDEQIDGFRPEEVQGIIDTGAPEKRGEPAETGFAPALRPSVMYEGKQYDGEVGGTHPDVMKENEIAPEAEHTRGFVDPDGKFLTRDEAEAWLKENDPETYKKWQAEAGKGAELHSEDLAVAKKEVIEDAVSEGQIEPDDKLQHRGADKQRISAGPSGGDSVLEGGKVTEEEKAPKKGAAALPGVDNTLNLINPETKFEKLPEEAETKSGDLFALTSEWQEIPTDATIEPGADVQMDMTSGKAYAKAGEKKSPKTEILFDKLREGGVQYDHEEIQSPERGDLPAEAKIAEGKEGNVPAAGRDDSSYPEVVSEKTGTYKVTSKKITNSADLAQLTDVNIGKQAQENLISVATDDKGNILSIYRHSLGMPHAAQVLPSIIVGQALNNPQAAIIWLAHNHPSGSPDLSIEDVRMGKNIENLMQGTSIKLGDSIAVGEDKYADSAGIKPIPRGEATKKVPVVERGTDAVFYSGIDITQLPKALRSLYDKLRESELLEAYKRPPEITESKLIIGKYTGALQEIDQKLVKWAKQIKDELPKDKQIAITNYLQAGGDETLLAQRAKDSKKEYRKGYEDALKLMPGEKSWADAMRGRLDEIWQTAYDADILEDYVENYVRGEWEHPDKAGKNIVSQVNAGSLRVNPTEARHKIFKDYYEGEQAGYKPKDKQIGYQTVAAERSIRFAIEARKAVKALMGSIEKDGRPTVVVGGGGRFVESKPKEGIKAAYYIKPNVRPDGKIDLAKMGVDEKSLPKGLKAESTTQDYKHLDHPALRRWKWIDKDTEGNPILMEGSMWIHPEAFGRINALLGKSKIQTYTIPEKVPIIGGTQPGRAALKAGGFIKGTMLVGPFHQFHVGEHALFHKVNPFGTPEIDFDARPVLREGVEHGLMLFNHKAMQEFGEGLASGGLLHRIPFAGDYLRRYQEWLFQDFIPRLKAAMFEAAVGRAEKYYEKELKVGTFTRDQLLDNVAKQGNAAFGEQNYKYLGRNPTLQDALRIALLAPDFLEARLKFFGQAARPHGKEQLYALIRGAIIMATAAQTINMLIGDDGKPDWKRPFSIIVGGREYTPRSVVGDMMHLVTDFRGFWYHRLNPLWGRPLVEIATGRDFYGRKVGPIDAAKDTLKSWVPLPTQGVFKDNMGDTFFDSTINALLQSVGLSNYAYKSDFERYAMTETQHTNKLPTDKSRLKRKLEQNLRDKKPDAREDIIQARREGKITAKERGEIEHHAKLSPTVKAATYMTLDELATGIDKYATNEEKKILKPIFKKRLMNKAGELNAEDKKKYIEMLNNM